MIIKAGDYTYGHPEKKIVMLNLQVPLIDTRCTSKEMIAKTKEELIELLWEVTEGDIDKQAALSEMFDVIQVMAGYLLAINRETYPNLNSVEQVKTQFDIASALHMTKMRFRSAERKWEMIYE